MRGLFAATEEMGSMSPMRRSRTTLFLRVLALSAAGAMMIAPSVALAQTTTTSPYPGTPTTAAPGPTEADIDLGPIETGGVVNVSECNFAPGTTITIKVNGTTISPSVVADSKGCIVVHIEVLPNLVALGRTV